MGDSVPKMDAGEGSSSGPNQNPFDSNPTDGFQQAMNARVIENI